MEKISICIPTYNRSNLLINQLDFLKNEILPFTNSIKIIVADNCSSPKHRNRIIDYHISNNFFELKLNDYNLGSIGNIYYLLECANSEYIWFVSDDDILLKGILKRVLEILSNHKDLMHIYLNYSAFYKNIETIDYTPDMLKYSGYYPEGKQCLIDLFEKNGPISMFITSCIYSLAPLKEFCSIRTTQTLMDPLLFSLKLAVGPTYIETNIYILERCDNPSWISEGLAIFSWQIQSGLIDLLKHSYNRNEIDRMIISLYESNRGNYLKMLLIAPKQSKKLLVNFLGVKQFKLIINSSLYNLHKLITRLLNICLSKR